MTIRMIGPKLRIMSKSAGGGGPPAGGVPVVPPGCVVWARMSIKFKRGPFQQSVKPILVMRWKRRRDNHFRRRFLLLRFPDQSGIADRCDGTNHIRRARSPGGCHSSAVGRTGYYARKPKWVQASHPRKKSAGLPRG